MIDLTLLFQKAEAAGLRSPAMTIQANPAGLSVRFEATLNGKHAASGRSFSRLSFETSLGDLLGKEAERAITDAIEFAKKENA